MNLVEMTSRKLGELLGREISDAVVLVAKNMILGNTEEGVGDILGCSIQEVREITGTADYKDAHLVMASHYNNASIEADLSYDDIEQRALKRIGDRIDRETDIDRLVRVATMANRATRRHQVAKNQDTLDPSLAGRRVQLTLTKRIVEQLASGNQVQETRQISIHGTDHTNPTFDQIDEFFGVTNRPRLADNYRPAGELDGQEVTIEDLNHQIEQELAKK